MIESPLKGKLQEYGDLDCMFECIARRSFATWVTGDLPKHKWEVSHQHSCCTAELKYLKMRRNFVLYYIFNGWIELFKHVLRQKPLSNCGNCTELIRMHFVWGFGRVLECNLLVGQCQCRKVFSNRSHSLACHRADTTSRLSGELVYCDHGGGAWREQAQHPWCTEATLACSCFIDQSTPEFHCRYTFMSYDKIVVLLTETKECLKIHMF